MKRGDIWTVSGGKDYASKPRPVVIVQDDNFETTDSVSVCGLTTDQSDAPLFRPPVEPSAGNGLRVTSRMMIDKITTVPKSKVGEHIGRLGDEDVVRLNRAMMVFLGLASSPQPSSRSAS
ncbi:type II toxin-antitoxin system PemK/MazF family toxin [Caulobacter segnis]|uniref:Growth inhibitor PemK n=1 Tax=Caulobacter segnis TaxID=88688 RepID=A0A2W5WTB9_9CAUL|nr:type II toxin-antitoxin system PemK/MazF family toxin [Caulobacter segnis]PZR37448.1 MAG: growth inhibitor PemK [Caulobacter segnis]